MPKVFVGHSDKGAALAAEVHRWLVDGDHEAFLDRDLSDDLVLTRTHTLRPLQPGALRSVIEGPTHRAGIGIVANQVTRLVTDTGGGDALPLLARTLAQLNNGIGRGGRLTSRCSSSCGAFSPIGRWKPDKCHQFSDYDQGHGNGVNGLELYRNDEHAGSRRN